MRGYAAIGLDRPKDPANLGGVMRAAGCFGADLVVVGGSRMKHHKTDTQKAWRHIPVIEAASVWTVPFGAVPVCIEIMDGAQSLKDFEHPASAFYIFGPEDGSVSKEVAQLCKHKVYVPTAFCMNLAATVNVVLYDRMAKA